MSAVRQGVSGFRLGAHCRFDVIFRPIFSIVGPLSQGFPASNVSFTLRQNACFSSCFVKHRCPNFGTKKLERTQYE